MGRKPCTKWCLPCKRNERTGSADRTAVRLAVRGVGVILPPVAASHRHRPTSDGGGLSLLGFFWGGGVGSSRPPATSATLPQTAATCFRAWRCEPCRSVVAPHRRRSLAPVGGDSRSCVASSWRSGWARPGPTAHGNCAWRALHVVGAAAFTQVSPGCDRGACGVGCPAAVDEGPAAADGRPPHAVDADGGGGGCSR